MVLVGITLSFGSAYYHFAPRVYYSRAVVAIEESSEGQEIAHAAVAASVLTKRLQAPRLVEATAGDLGLSGTAREIALKHIRETRLHAPNHRTLEVEIWCSSQDLAAQWVKTLLEHYNASERTKHFNAARTVPAAFDEISAPSSGAPLLLRFERLVEIPNGPTSPRLNNVIFTTVLAALLLGAGVPILVETVRRAVTDLQRGETLLALRGLAALPQLAEPFNRAAFLRGDDSVWAQAREITEPLRETLFVSDESRKTGRVALITSARADEGKTTAAIQLALACAAGGKKTLLIDADVEGGDLHRVFGYRAGPGVSDVILDPCVFESACRETMFENLTVLPLGLETRPLGEDEIAYASWADQLRLEFECVIVDGCAVEDGEAGWWLSIADTVALVVARGRTPLKATRRAIAMLRRANRPIAGFVLNRGGEPARRGMKGCATEPEMTLVQAPC